MNVFTSKRESSEGSGGRGCNWQSGKRKVKELLNDGVIDTRDLSFNALWRSRLVKAQSLKCRGGLLGANTDLAFESGRNRRKSSKVPKYKK